MLILLTFLQVYKLADEALDTTIPAMNRVARRALPYSLDHRTQRVSGDTSPTNLERLLNGDDFNIVRPSEGFVARLRARQARKG